MGETALWSHHTTLPAERRSAAKARDFVTRHVAEHQLVDLAEDIRLVVTELATNATVHAGTPFTVLLQGFPGSVLLTVQDDSPSPPISTFPPPLATSGRGLPIVELFSSDWGLTTTTKPPSKSIWASFTTR